MMLCSAAERGSIVARTFIGVRAGLMAFGLVAALLVASCGRAEPEEQLGPGGYGFDRSDPETGIANIVEAFGTDQATATCIYEAWGDVADVPPAELTPELMTFEICDTSIFQLMTGDPRFTGADG